MIEMKNTTLLTKNLNMLNEEDILNDVLYLIYKLNDDPKYSVLSELIYILGKDSLFKLCSILGGCEIKIPTLFDLKLFIGALYVYSAMHNDGTTFEDAFKVLNLDTSLKKLIYAICMELESSNNNE